MRRGSIRRRVDVAVPRGLELRERRSGVFSGKSGVTLSIHHCRSICLIKSSVKHAWCLWLGSCLNKLDVWIHSGIQREQFAMCWTFSLLRTREESGGTGASRAAPKTRGSAGGGGSRPAREACPCAAPGFRGTRSVGRSFTRTARGSVLCRRCKHRCPSRRGCAGRDVSGAFSCRTNGGIVALTPGHT